ncbi:hypothetical protein FH972_026499 [Carpinus fangiana]|uniref:Uncharacterized protein n=1 Tax=Carpinus fangiana TaxID=176857 RepID=A0A5N6L4H4_9ROSI|nr:hypothetical protein FH972_026499 [Carpinus fangiana]
MDNPPQEGDNHPDSAHSAKSFSSLFDDPSNQAVNQAARPISVEASSTSNEPLEQHFFTLCDPLAPMDFDTAWLTDVGFNGATLVPGAAGVIRQTSQATPQATLDGFQASDISFHTPDYAQVPRESVTNLDANGLNFSLSQNIDWPTALDIKFGLTSMGANEAENVLDGSCVGTSSIAVEAFQLPSIDQITQDYDFPMLDNTDTEATATNTSEYPSTIDPRLYGSIPVSFSGHRGYQPAFPSTKQFNVPPPTTQPSPSPTESHSSVEQSNASSPQHSKITGFSPKLPQKFKDKPWIRSSGSDRNPAGSTRTAAQLQYNPRLHYKPSGRINENLWQGSDGTKFEYNEHGELDYSTLKLSPEAMETFLYENPAQKGIVLWIQIHPADSNSRYPTPGSSKCSMKTCPAFNLGSRWTIAVGHLRVAIDEAWNKRKEARDPYHCAGFMHLYCAERFLDWKKICKKLDVRIDDRGFYATEPNHRYKARIEASSEVGEVANRFLRSARPKSKKGADNFDKKYPQYPPHIPPAGPKKGYAEKDYEHTLCYSMMNAKVNSMPATRKKLLAGREQTDSQMLSSLGDLQKIVDTKLAKRAQNKLERQESQRTAPILLDDSDDAASTPPTPAAPKRRGRPPKKREAPAPTSPPPKRTKNNAGGVFRDESHPARSAARKARFVGGGGGGGSRKLTAGEEAAKRAEDSVYAAEQAELIAESRQRHEQRQGDEAEAVLDCVVAPLVLVRRSVALVPYAESDDDEDEDY